MEAAKKISEPVAISESVLKHLERSKNRLIALGVTFLSFAFYLSTMSRSIPYIDGGELTTVLWTLGIAHPTGYPLFSLLGYLFVHIPFSAEVAVRANLFAATCTAVAGGMFYLVFVQALSVLQTATDLPIKITGKKRQILTLPAARDKFEIKITLASLLAALSLTFSRTFWDQSTSIEVYPLQLVLFAAIILVWFRLYQSPTKSVFLFAGLALGLGFTNHMTTILTVPALFFLFISGYRRSKFDLTILPWMIAGGAIAGCLYIYLPLRASQSPILNWGNPDNLERFIRHVTGKQFRTWMFSSTGVFEKQLGVFFSGLFAEFGIGIFVAIVGIIYSLLFSKLLGSYRKFLWFGLLLIAGDLTYAANYDIHDIQSYFLLSYVSLGMFAALGFLVAIQAIGERTKMNLPFLLALFVFPATTAIMNYGPVNESQDQSVEKYTIDILSVLPSNSLVLSYQWDNFVSASLYYQNVKTLRRDVIVIDKELLRRSWYSTQVHNRYPFLFPSSDVIYERYMANLRLFENDLPYDPEQIESSYSSFIREIIAGASREGWDVFVGPELEDQYLKGYYKVPYGLLYQLTSDTAYVPFDVSKLDGFIAAKSVKTDYSAQIVGFYERMFMARAAYEYSHKELDSTLACLDKGLQVDPLMQTAQAARTKILQELKLK